MLLVINQHIIHHFVCIVVTDVENSRVVTQSDWSSLETKSNRIMKEKQSFDRLEVAKEDLRKMFAYSKYKLHYIDKLVTGEKSTVYRCGTLVDLCRGPHIQSTGKIKNFKIMQVINWMVQELLCGCAPLTPWLELFRIFPW